MTKKAKTGRGRKKKTSRPLTIHEQLGALAKAINAKLDREEAYTRAMNEKYKDAPMISEPVFRIHS
jgi:hypothetical protein